MDVSYLTFDLLFRKFQELIGNTILKEVNLLVKRAIIYESICNRNNPLYYSFIQSQLSLNDPILDESQSVTSNHFDLILKTIYNSGKTEGSGCHSNTVIGCPELISDFRFLFALKVTISITISKFKFVCNSL